MAESLLDKVDAIAAFEAAPADNGGEELQPALDDVSAIAAAAHEDASQMETAAAQAADHDNCPKVEVAAARAADDHNEASQGEDAAAQAAAQDDAPRMDAAAAQEEEEAASAVTAPCWRSKEHQWQNRSHKGDLDEEELELWQARGRELVSLLRTQPNFDRCSRKALTVAERETLCSALSVEGCSTHGLSLMATTLQGVQGALRDLEDRLLRLNEDFLCLDDGDAEHLFGGTGDLVRVAGQAKELATQCREASAAVLQPDRTWAAEMPDPRPFAPSLATGCDNIELFSGYVEALTSRRRVSVSRAKAVVEAIAVSEAESARGLLAEVLTHRKRADFPVVTEICARLAGDEEETKAVVELLRTALTKTCSDISAHLKAVTVINELLYDDVARQMLAAEPGLLEAVSRLSNRAQSDHGSSEEVAVETMSVLALEIERQLQVERKGLPEATSKRSPVEAEDAHNWLWPFGARSAGRRASLDAKPEKGNNTHGNEPRGWRRRSPPAAAAPTAGTDSPAAMAAMASAPATTGGSSSSTAAPPATAPAKELKGSPRLFGKKGAKATPATPVQPLFDAPGMPGQGSALQLLTGPAARWPERRTCAEAICHSLRLVPVGWFGAGRHRQKTTAPPAEIVAIELDELFRCLDGMVRSLKELHTELCAPGSASSGVAEDIEELASTMLVSAAEVLKHSVEWKCALLDVADPASPNKDKEAKGSMLEPGSRQAALLMSFLDKAVSVGNSLSACLAVFLARKEDAKGNASNGSVADVKDEHPKGEQPKATFENYTASG